MAMNRPDPLAVCRSLAAVVLGILVVSAALAAVPFEDRTASAGLRFEHFNGMSGELYFSEMAGAGVALLDYDRDDDLDVFVVQGSMLGAATSEAATFAPRHQPPYAHRLYRNDLEVGPSGERTLRFTDVTIASGITSAGYGMGATAGDYDGDGWVDLYVTNLGHNQLLHNDGDGTFSDVTAPAGVDDQRWSVSAAFFDYDRDGRLDLYVGNYVDFRVATHKSCSSPSGALDYCGPSAFGPEADRLFRNRGDGTFEDATVAAGIARSPAPSLGEAVGDFDGNGYLDLYIANDGAPNFLWLNRGDGTFVDEALLGGCAVNAEGQPEASMGVVPGDFDADGDIDLFMTHLDRETNTIYLNDGSALFSDATEQSGLGMTSWSSTGFGTARLDFDGDGILDLFVANGAVKRIEAQLRSGEPHPLRQPNLLYRGLGSARFEDITAAAGPAFATAEVSRGVAAGDLDNDGDLDLVVTNNGGSLRLLVNTSETTRPWVGLRLMGGSPRRDQLGARVALVKPGGGPIWRMVSVDGSYASSGDPRVLWRGLGSAEVIVRVEWPDGTSELFPAPETGRYTTLEQGTGRPAQ